MQELVGKSIVSAQESENGTTIELVLSDGGTIVAQCSEYVDCCGYNSIQLAMPDGFDFADNVITKVEHEGDNGTEASFKLGIFTSDTRMKEAEITLEGEAGSGTGWNYGQYVELLINGY